jgi:hypothetical protein
MKTKTGKNSMVKEMTVLEHIRKHLFARLPLIPLSLKNEPEDFFDNRRDNLTGSRFQDAHSRSDSGSRLAG